MLAIKIVYFAMPMKKANKLCHFGPLFTYESLTWAHLFGQYQQNLLLLINYQSKAVCTKCRYKRTIFHNKCELLKCCRYGKHYDQIHHNIRWNGLDRSVFRIYKKTGSWLLRSDNVLLLTNLVLSETLKITILTAGFQTFDLTKGMTSRIHNVLMKGEGVTRPVTGTG